MSRFRTRWLALFGGVTLIALSLSTAFAGRPEGENRGQQVSAFVHSLIGADEETEEDTEVEEDEVEEDEVEEDESASSEHGKCVAEVAQSDEVGPPNDNHGGAVSEAARVTCWEDAADESSGEEPSEDESDSQVESDKDGDSEDAEDAEDAEESDSGSDHGNGHGNGNGGDRSDD